MKAKHRYASALSPIVFKPEDEFVCEEHRFIYKYKDGCPECKELNR